MATQQLKDIENCDQVISALENNFAQKVAFFPAQLEGMQVHRRGDVLFVDSGVRSDTFNCAFGGAFTRADSEATAEAVLRYYQDKRLPMAWWVGPSSHSEARRAVLERVGFSQSETEVGMAALLDDIAMQVDTPPELEVTAVRTPVHLQDFGRVLASVFEPFDEEVVRYYARVGSRIEALGDRAKLFIGYVEGAPATIGGAFISAEVAGIYDIATDPRFRKRGYGTVMTSIALQAARASGHRVVGLQASTDGLGIYKKLGFRPFCGFDVYGIRG